MHIGFLTSEYPPMPSGGIGTSIYTLASALVKLGHKVTVIGWGNPIDFFDNGVHVKFLAPTRVPKMGWLLNRRMTAKEINRMVREENLDILEAPDWCGLSAGMRLECPVVVRCHGSDTYFGKLLGYEPRKSVFLAEKMAIKGANGVLSVSKYAANITRQIFQVKSPIEIIPNGINLDLYPIGFNTNEEGLILHFGTLARKKGVLDLANVFSRIVEKNHKSRLILVGRDVVDKVTGVSMWTLIQNKMSSLALASTSYVGVQPYSQMKQYISKAAVCAFPSYAEALPVSWLEAMACGKAVVCSNIGWATEIVEDGVSGLLVHPQDHAGYASAVLNVLEDAELRQRLGSAARKRVETLFSNVVVAKQTVDYYQKVLDRFHNKRTSLVD